ncbi:hypothetical protein JY651_03370 [Pyxidicoccus parkwayensis]|uniref:Lipoprotein n=1 Tax=Pyxidicoccus parkwayensis TaxID=2813578 RepID=A0ABX7NYM1_9BACT|nr:hypothetical protein [Pyxidicoccus parkwaysis]QSQ24032.1 hypothetical protein JY651_03370 [Pyxidicoccus parkwaysis]
MIPAARHAVVPWLVLLSLLQGGCLAESALDGGELKCGPRDLTPECCLKQNPGNWQKCTGAEGPAEAGISVAMKITSVGAAAALALQPIIGSAERRGVELATDLHSDVEAAILKCVRRAERQGNDHYFDGESPSREQCAELKMEGQTWGMYLGAFKHKLAWDCIHEALSKLLPRRYLFEPRFRLNDATGEWEYLSPERVDRILALQGWKGLRGTIVPDIVIMDASGVIIHVYDMKFPCPESNDANWTLYKSGRWLAYRQDDLYHQVLQVWPRLVSPHRGWEPLRK